MTRRTLFLGGAAASVAATGYVGVKVYEGIRDGVASIDRDLAAFQRTEALSQSTSFNEAITRAGGEYGTRHEVREGAERSEIDIIIDRSESDRINGQSCASFFREHALKGISESEIPATVQEELSHLVPGLIAFESRYRNDDPGENVKTWISSEDLLARLAHPLNTPTIAKDEQGNEMRRPDGSVCIVEKALGRVQALPTTFTEYGFDITDIQDPHKQAEFLGKYFKETYRVFRATEAFNAIKLKYFPHDQEAFRKYFVVPAMINAYHGGPGTIQDLVRWFAARRFRPELVNAGYDVYHAMTMLALEKKDTLTNDARNFGPYGAEYVPHAFALSGLMSESRARRESHLPS